MSGLRPLDLNLHALAREIEEQISIVDEQIQRLRSRRWVHDRKAKRCRLALRQLHLEGDLLTVEHEIEMRRLGMEIARVVFGR